jgi:DNA-directed RNA polymerase subunit RPC12/RpoP
MRIKKVEVKALAHYQCVKCKKEYHTKPGSVSCTCGSKYLTWLNFPDCLEYTYEKEAHENDSGNPVDAGRDSQPTTEEPRREGGDS